MQLQVTHCSQTTCCTCITVNILQQMAELVLRASCDARWVVTSAMASIPMHLLSCYCHYSVTVACGSLGHIQHISVPLTLQTVHCILACKGGGGAKMMSPRLCQPTSEMMLTHAVQATPQPQWPCSEVKPNVPVGSCCLTST